MLRGRGPATRGMTLIEFLITITIFGILAVVAIPSMRSFIRNHRISATAEELYSALQFARTEAIKRNTNVYVSFTTGDNWCYGINPGATCNCATVGSCTLGTYSAASSQQLSLSLTGLSGNSVNFEGAHGAANASGAVTFTLYGGTSLITVSISRMGNIQMCSTGITGYTAC